MKRMKRVRYPFIVRYESVDGEWRYGREGLDNLDFERIDSPLEATVYRNCKEFRAGFMSTPTAFYKFQKEQERASPFLFGPTELVYVGA
jgi:hypothetical protein